MYLHWNFLFLSLFIMYYLNFLILIQYFGKIQMCPIFSKNNVPLNYPAYLFRFKTSKFVTYHTADLRNSLKKDYFLYAGAQNNVNTSDLFMLKNSLIKKSGLTLHTLYP